MRLYEEIGVKSLNIHMEGGFSVVHTTIEDLKQRILPLREQGRITDRWLEHRLKSVLPSLMEREGIDIWLVIAREYNEDPVFLSLMPSGNLSARRRSILLFHKNEGELKCLHFGKSDLALNQHYNHAWDRDTKRQWEALAGYIKKAHPKTLGLNISDTFSLGDGLSKSQYDELMKHLDKSLIDRIVSSERLAVGWLETRTEEELQVYDGINRIAHDVIEKAYSREIIHTGLTTALDLSWWIRQTLTDMGLNAWFQPTISIQRKDDEKVTGDTAILPGDLLHCDVGFHYLKLATDTQQMAYVLRPGESSPPEELVKALEKGNRLQDIFTANFEAGRTGNEILNKTLKEAQEEGLKGMIYTHPIGTHGHGAGPTMGLFDKQSRVKGNGDYPLYDNTSYAIELNVKDTIASWKGREIMIALEQTASFINGKVEYHGGRQKEFHCV